MSKMRSIERPATISETIYDYLKKAIIRGDYPPGRRLQDKEFAALFNVSSTPVREAFFRLAAEKYLTINTRKEVLVLGMSPEEVKELYDVVRALDSYAIRNAVKNLTKPEIEHIQQMTEKLGEYYKAGDHQKYLEHNLKIHERIWKAGGSRSIYEVLTQMREKIAIYSKHNDFSPYADPKAMEKSYQDHLKLLEGLINGDVKTLIKIAETHWD